MPTSTVPLCCGGDRVSSAERPLATTSTSVLVTADVQLRRQAAVCP